MNKPFSSSLYTENDNAKELIINWLISKGFEAWVNTDQYGIDIVYHDETAVYRYCEVEVKHNWKGSEFPFSTVHFPKRKLKFANVNSMFAMLNHERTHVLLISGQQFIDAPIICKDTIYTKNEEFIEITIQDCKIVNLMEESNE